MRQPPLRASLARLLRHRRSVLMTYPGLRLGNVLYFALRAFSEQQRGSDYVVLDPDPGNDWASGFPRLASLLLPPSELHVLDKRVDLVESFFQGFGTDFSRDELERFIRTVLLTGPALQNVKESCRDDDAPSVTVNVRRGDYYDNPDFKALFGFDVQSYVRTAISEVERTTGPLASVLVVSDGIGWCRQHLDWLGDHAPSLYFEGSENGIQSNLRRLAEARRLIITNSTFSYWGAYLSNVVHGDRHGGVWVPSLHSRAIACGQAWQHDPRWRVVNV